MISAFHAIKINISLKINFLHNHLDFFQIWVNSVRNTWWILSSRYCDHWETLQRKRHQIHGLVNTVILLFVIQNGIIQTANQDSYSYNYNYIVIIIHKFENIWKQIILSCFFLYSDSLHHFTCKNVNYLFKKIII